MPSSIEFGENLRHSKEVASATKLVKKNIKHASPEDFHLAVLHFEQLRWKLDKIPMTRTERMEFDDMVSTMGRILGNNDNT